MPQDSWSPYLLINLKKGGLDTPEVPQFWYPLKASLPNLAEAPDEITELVAFVQCESGRPRLQEMEEFEGELPWRVYTCSAAAVEGFLLERRQQDVTSNKKQKELPKGKKHSSPMPVADLTDGAMFVIAGDMDFMFAAVGRLLEFCSKFLRTEDNSVLCFDALRELRKKKIYTSAESVIRMSCTHLVTVPRNVTGREYDARGLLNQLEQQVQIVLLKDRVA